MRKQNSKAILLAAAFLLAGFAVAQEKKVKRSDLPPAVEKTVASESAGATVKGFAKETEKEQTYYEAEIIVNGHTKDILIDTNGGIVEVEEEIAIDLLPAKVKAGLQAQAGPGKLVRVESITKQNKLVAYEAQVEKDGKKSEVQVGPRGEPLGQKD